MVKWLKFEHTRNSKSGKTKIWEVLTTYDNSLLGIISWFGRWRKYSFYPAPNTVFEKDCLRDIADFEEGKSVQRKVYEALYN